MTTHSKSLMIAAGSQASTANTVQYWKVAGAVTVSATEAQTELVFRKAGWLSNLTVILSANSVTGSTIFLLRKNTTTNLTQTVTFGSTATGTQEDTTHTDFVAAGDRIVLKSTPGAATNTFTVRTISMLFYADVNTVSKLATGSFSLSTASTTSYVGFSQPAPASSEANAKSRMRKGGTLTNLAVYVSANRAQASTVRLRKNGTTDGNNVVTITGGGAAGWYEDQTPHTDTVTAADDWYFTVLTGTGVDTLTIQSISCEFVSTAGDTFLVSGHSTPVAVADASSRYFQLGGALVATSGETGATGSDLEANAAFTATEMTCLVTQNDVGSASTCRLRVGAANVNNTMSITASTPGLYGDTTPHTDVLTAASLINAIVTVPSVSGSHTVTVAAITLSMGMTELTLVPQTYTHIYNIKKLVQRPSTIFDGSGDYIDCGNHSDLWSQSLTKFSFAVWVYPTLIDTSTRDIMRHGATGAARFRCDIELNTGDIRWYIRNNADSADATSKAAGTVINKWQHIIGTYDNSLGSANVKVFLNNVQGGTTANDSETKNTLSAILGLGSSASSSQYLQGNLKDFRWWSTIALDSTQRTNVYNNSDSAPAPDYWLKMDEGTGTPVDSVASKTTSFVGNATWDNLSPATLSGKLFTHRYKIRNLAVQTFTHKWNIINHIAQTFTHKWNIRNLISQTYTHKWNIKNLVSKTYTHKYNIHNLIAQTYTHIYNILSSAILVAQTYTHKYNIHNLIAQTYTHKWNIHNLVSKTYTHKWNIKNLVSKTYTHIYKIRNLVVQTFTHKWNIHNLIVQTFTHKYNIRNLISQTYTHKYNIKSLISQTYIHKYGIKNLISQTFIHIYKIRNLATQTFAHKYGIRNLAAQVFTHKYNIINTVSKTFTHIYNILGIGVVTKSFTHKYNIHNLTSQTYTHKWNILETVNKIFTHSYNILNAVSKLFTHIYNIRNLAAQVFTHKYGIKNLVAAVYNHRYNILAIISQSFTHRYNILTLSVNNTFIHIYNIRNLVNKTYTHRYDIKTLATILVTKIKDYFISKYQENDPSL